LSKLRNSNSTENVFVSNRVRFREGTGHWAYKTIQGLVGHKIILSQPYINRERGW